MMCWASMSLLCQVECSTKLLLGQRLVACIAVDDPLYIVELGEQYSLRSVLMT